MFMLDSSHIAQLAKSNQQVIIISDYYSHEIVAPNSWEKALFSEICQIIGGSQPPKEYFINEPQEGYIRLIQIRDYKTDKFATYIPIELAKRFCQKEDIMIGRYGPPIFQILRGLEGAYNVALMKAEPNTNLFDKEFLYYFLQTPQLFNYVASASLRTAGQDGVRKELLDNYPVFVPPLNEQRRIVAKIEALKARSQRVKEELEAIAPLLDQFRQSVLAAAFRGDLTADWREKNPDVEPASVLLERIRAERRRRWKEAELEKMKAQGKTPKDDKWKDRYQEPESVDDNNLPSLPDNWCWVKWEQSGFCQNGRAFPSKEYQTDGIKLLRPGNLHMSGRIEWTESNTRFMDEEWAEKYPDFIIGSNELVINLTAQSLADEFLGRICLTSEGEKCLLNQRIARLTPTIISPRFFLWLFKSRLFRRYVDGLNTGSLIQHMFTSQINEFVFPLPPLDEQEVIINLIEAKMKSIEEIRHTVADGLNAVPQLNQSILAKAFRGELVPQDPNDEPASVLLERIRAEREKLDTKKKAKGKTEKKSRKAKPELAEPKQLSLPGFE
jgi:type I restriction enzyme S subunit